MAEGIVHLASYSRWHGFEYQPRDIPDWRFSLSLSAAPRVFGSSMPD